MKKILTSMLCLGLCAAAMLSSCAKDEKPVETPEKENEAITDVVENELPEVEVPEEQLDYEFSIDSFNFTAVITGYNGEEEDVVIPAAITDPVYGDVCPVVEIGTAAFLGNETMKTVTIPDGVTKIGEGAFQSCIALEKASLPETVEEIGSKAFYNSALAEINIPKKLTTIGKYAFSTMLNETPWYASLKDEKVIVGDGILLKYNGKGDVTFGDEVERVAYYAFRNPGEIDVKFLYDLKGFDDKAVFETEGLYKINFLIPYKSEAEAFIDATPYKYTVHGVPEVKGNPFVWNMDSKAEMEESWYGHLFDMSFSPEGALHATTTAVDGHNDPILECKDSLYLPAEDFKFCVIKMKHSIVEPISPADTYLQVYYDNGAGLAEARSKRVEIGQNSNGEYIEYRLDMTESEGWNGIITYFRIDPFNNLSGEVWIDSVEFIASDAAYDYNKLLKPVTKDIPGEENPYKFKFAEQKLADAWTTAGIEYSYDEETETIHGTLDAAAESSITSPALDVPGEAYRKIIVRMKHEFDAEKTEENANDFLMKVYFDNGEGYSEERCKSTVVPKTSGGEKIEYEFDMYKLAGWYGTVKGIKIVLPSNMGGEFFIDKIEFVDETKLTKAEFMSMLYEADGKESVSEESVFYDVVVYDKYCNAVIWAYENDLINRSVDNMFYPDRKISAEEYLDIMTKYVELRGSEADVALPEYAKGVIYEMDAQKIVNKAAGVEEEEEEEEVVEIFIDEDPANTWTFKDESEIEEWGTNCVEKAYADGTLYGKVVPNADGGYDPILSVPSVEIDAASFKTFKIKMKYKSENEAASVSGNNTLQVYFDNGSGLSEANSVRTEINTASDEFVEYTLDMGANEAWTGTISFFRVDITNNVDGEFWIESIAFAE